MSASYNMHQNAQRYLHTQVGKQGSESGGGGGGNKRPDWKDMTDEELLLWDFSVLDEGEDELSYGVLIDFTDGKSSPELTRIGNMDLHRSLPVQSEYKGCIWDYTNKEILYYLNPDNWNLGTDEKTAAEVKADMENPAYGIRVETPKFYVCSKVLATDGAGNTTMAKVMFSTRKVNHHYIEIPRQVTDFRNTRAGDDMIGSGEYELLCNLSNLLVGGYCTTKNSPTTGKDSLLHPITNIDRPTARDLAHNANTNLMCYEYWKWLFYWAFVIEYATLDTAKPVINALTVDGFHQGGLGPGMTSIESKGYTDRDGNYKYNEDYNIGMNFFGQNADIYFRSDDTDQFSLRDIGVTNALGNHTGEIAVEYAIDASPTSLVHQNRYRGFEFPFGDIYLNLDGFVGTTIKDGNDHPIAEAYFVCNNPEFFKDEVPTQYGGDDFALNGWRLAYWDAHLDSFHRNGYDEGAIMFANIGNTGDLFPQMWDADENYKFGRYFCNTLYPMDGTELATLYVGSVANSDDAAQAVGLLGFADANLGVGAAGGAWGFRCFNIIQDDGTVI